MPCDSCEYNKDYVKDNGFVYPECSHPDVRAEWYGNRPIDAITSRSPDWCPLDNKTYICFLCKKEFPDVPYGSDCVPREPKNPESELETVCTKCYHEWVIEHAEPGDLP